MIRTARRTLAMAVGLVGLLLLVPGFGALPAASPSGVRTTASGDESVAISVGTAFAFTPSDFEVTPGDNVTVTVTQLDSVQHTFTLLGAANFTFNQTDSAGVITAFLAKHPPLVSLNISGTPGTTVSKTFRAPSLGVYEYLCLVTGHFQSGMWGLMGSGVAVGPPETGNSVPWALYVITGVIVILVILAIVLGFVVGQREGARYEMPPERLGYPEPLAPSTPPSGRDPPGPGH
jgi:plastocyanin